MDARTIWQSLKSTTAHWRDDTRAMLALVSRVPLDGSAPEPRALRALPIAGALAGAAGGIVLIVADSAGLPPAACAIAAVTVLVLISGALHEDGLADVADGFGGGETPEQKLEIMRDSRIGSYGTIALVLSLLARVSLLAALVVVPGPVGGALAMVAVGALSRAAIVHLLVFLPPARADGLGHAAALPPRRTLAESIAAAALIAAAMTLATIGLIGLVLAAAGVVLAAISVSALARRQIGGQTGDVCGAAQQTAEIAALAGLVIAL